jgi:ribosomal protein S24E
MRKLKEKMVEGLLQKREVLCEINFNDKVTPAHHAIVLMILKVLNKI